MRNRDALAIGDLVEYIKPLIAGKPSEIVGGALADLAAIWIAGHVVPNDPIMTSRLRAEILATHVRFIAELVALNAKMIGAELAASEPKGRA
jgi:hypothetical protein